MKIKRQSKSSIPALIWEKLFPCNALYGLVSFLSFTETCFNNKYYCSIECHRQGKYFQTSRPSLPIFVDFNAKRSKKMVCLLCVNHAQSIIGNLQGWAEVNILIVFITHTHTYTIWFILHENKNFSYANTKYGRERKTANEVLFVLSIVCV